MPESEEEDMSMLGDFFLIMELPEIRASSAINGAIRDEVLKSLITAGVLTKQQLSDALDRGEKEVEAACSQLELDDDSTLSRETCRKMRTQAKYSAGRVRSNLIDG